GNTILGSTKAYADHSVITSAQNVTLDADNLSTINAEIVGVSVALGGGLAGGLGLSIGAAVTENTIGRRDLSPPRPLEVLAYLKDTSVAAEGDLELTATSSQTIHSTVNAISVAASSGYVSIGLSGAGGGTSNNVAADVKAYIDGDGATGIVADKIALSAQDTSIVTATTRAVSLSLGIGVISGALSVAEADAFNTVTNVVEAS